MVLLVVGSQADLMPPTTLSCSPVRPNRIMMKATMASSGGFSPKTGMAHVNSIGGMISEVPAILFATLPAECRFLRVVPYCTR